MNNKEKKEKIYKIIAIVLLIITLMGELTLLGVKIRTIRLNKELEKINRVSMEASVTIKEFGNRLKNFYLTAPEEEVKKAIEENYRDFLSPTLLNLWLEDPSKALGRVTSSPWPERIEFIGIFPFSNDDQYVALGRIIEVTSVEMIEGGEANSQIAKFTIKKINGKWLIDNIEIENTK